VTLAGEPLHDDVPEMKVRSDEYVHGRERKRERRHTSYAGFSSNTNEEDNEGQSSRKQKGKHEPNSTRSEDAGAISSTLAGLCRDEARLTETARSFILSSCLRN
jgi:hypothetical protein